VLEISAAKEDTQLAGTTPTEARTQVTAGELAFLAYAVQMNIPAREVDRSRWLVRAELPDPVLSGKTVGTLLRFKFRGEEIPTLPDWRQSGAL